MFGSGDAECPRRFVVADTQHSLEGEIGDVIFFLERNSEVDLLLRSNHDTLTEEVLSRMLAPAFPCR